jgi:RNA polymerase sigma-70 factor, ECF subfamily
VVPSSMSDEFGQAAEPFRRELLVHCYRMLGSVHDAQDLVQETLTRAWRAFDRYDPQRASLRTWLYRIATNACLNALESRTRRPLPSGVGQPFDDPEAAFVPGFEVPWLQPFPDDLLRSTPNDPALSAVERSRLRLALVAAMQLLPARPRAVLILREVLDVSADEVAEMLDMTPAAVNSALQRARRRLDAAGIDPDTMSEPEKSQRTVVDRYVAAFERADVAGLTRLLTDDVVLEMPPMWNWYLGADAYGGFLARVFRTRGADWRMVPVAANGQPAVAAYARQAVNAYELHTVHVFTVDHGAISRTTVFQDPDVFGLFNLAATVPGRLAR